MDDSRSFITGDIEPNVKSASIAHCYVTQEPINFTEPKSGDEKYN